MIDKLATNIVIINDSKLFVKVALTEFEQSYGLMHLTTPPNMIFPYKQAQVNTFWMKNTPCPLDIVFCLAGKIVKICSGKPYSTEMIGNTLSDLVFETVAGNCAKNNINVGDSIKLAVPINELGENFNKFYK